MVGEICVRRIHLCVIGTSLRSQCETLITYAKTVHRNTHERRAIFGNKIRFKLRQGYAPFYLHSNYVLVLNSNDTNTFIITGPLLIRASNPIA